MDCPRDESMGVLRVGRTCVCGEHDEPCEHCGVPTPYWNNPHYQSAVGHYSHPDEAITPSYRCIGVTIPWSMRLVSA